MTQSNLENSVNVAPDSLVSIGNLNLPCTRSSGSLAKRNGISRCESPGKDRTASTGNLVLISTVSSGNSAQKWRSCNGKMDEKSMTDSQNLVPLSKGACESST